MSMGFLSLVGNSFGCSASGERLVTAARDGDVQEAKALLEYNPRLARNYRGQTALMQACQYGHWEVVQTLILYKANIHRADYLNGGTALHLAALNGHSRCVRLLLADYVPSTPNFYNIMKKRSRNKEFISELDEGALYEVINRPADGGINALHMAALNGHAETVQLLLDLGASVSEVTVEDGSTIDLIGAGSTPLHYAACGGNALCCQLLIARGATLTSRNANGWTPLMAAQSWHRDWLHEILSSQPESQPQPLPSPYLCLPLMSIVNIARECGWTTNNPPLAIDPCVVCLERKCTVAAEGCFHEFCTQCALYLCSTSTTSTTGHGPPGSIPCPLCRHGIVSFVKLADTKPAVKETARTNLSLPFCSCSADGQELDPIEIAFCKPDTYCARVSPNSSFRSSSFQKFPLAKFSPGLCMGIQETSPSLVSSNDRSMHNSLTRCSRSSFRRSTSNAE